MSSRQKPLPYVVYHSPCLDGFGAAYAVWRALGDSARYVPLNYTDAVPGLRKGADVYMVDLSFRRPVMLDLATRHDLWVLDHHETAEKELAGISDEAPNIRVTFDMARSGAMIAWEHFHAGDPPQLLRHVQDRDLWRHALPGTKAITLALTTHPQDFAAWHGIVEAGEAGCRALAAEGEALLRQQAIHVAALVAEARAARFPVGAGSEARLVVAPAVNAPYFLSSEVGHALLERFPDAPFAAVYRDAGSGRRDWSLRSADGRQHVGDVARGCGGGGHRNASGFAESFAMERILFDPEPFAR
jgi:hypothetical protein